MVHRPKTPSDISVFHKPTGGQEHRRRSSPQLIVWTPALKLQPNTEHRDEKASCPCFLQVGVSLPWTGGHNICPCWSRPSCRRCRTSGAGTVERKRETWKWCSGTCVSDVLLLTNPRGKPSLPSSQGKKGSDSC